MATEQPKIDRVPGEAVPPHSSETRRTAYTYQVPLQPFYTITVIWSLITGLAIGIGLAMVVEANGGHWISYARIQWFTTVLVAIFVFGALYRTVLQHHTLRILFDDRQRLVLIRPPFLRGQRQEIAFSDMLQFEMIAWPVSWQTGAALVLNTVHSGTITLVVLVRPSLIESSGLPSLTNRLNAHLDTVRKQSPHLDPQANDTQAAYYQPHTEKQPRRSRSSRPLLDVHPAAAPPRAIPDHARETQEYTMRPLDDQAHDAPPVAPVEATEPTTEPTTKTDHIPFGLRPAIKHKRTAPEPPRIKRLPTPELRFRRRRGEANSDDTKTTPLDTDSDDNQQPAE